MKKSYHSSELPTSPAPSSLRHSLLLIRPAPACSAMTSSLATFSLAAGYPPVGGRIQADEGAMSARERAAARARPVLKCRLTDLNRRLLPYHGRLRVGTSSGCWLIWLEGALQRALATRHMR